MKDKFIPYSRHFITESDIKAVVNVLRSDYLTQGPCIHEFEDKISEIVNSSFSVAVNSGTSALHLSCLALGVGKGDSVWTSPNTFVASANCARYCGANVDFVDIDKSTGLMNVGSLEDKLRVASKLNKLPKVVIPVHFSGSSCDMQSISKLRDKYGFSIIEDASHALGAKYLEKPVGSCSFSDITVFSFHPVKMITTGEGGLASTNNKNILDKLIHYRTHGITRNKDKFRNQSQGEWHYEQHELGYNYRMSDISAALGISQIDGLQASIKARSELRNKYINDLSGLDIDFLKIPDDVKSSLHLCVLQLSDRLQPRYTEIFESLRNYKIGVQLHYMPVHLQPYYMDMGFKRGDYPEAEDYSSRSLSIPLFKQLSDKDYSYIIQKLRRICC